MKQLLQNLPVGYKLFALFLLALLLIEAVATRFVWHYESTLLLQKERQNLAKELQTHAGRLTEHLDQLQKEIAFLARLEVMDDILAKDVDQRILTLLEQKATDLSEGIVLVVSDPDNRVIIAPKGYLSLPIAAFANTFLMLHAPVFASFDKERRKSIGTLWLLYPYDNLRHLTIGDTPAKILWLQPPPQTLHFPIPDTTDTIILSRKLTHILHGWKIHIAYRRTDALATLHEIERMQLYTFGVTAILLSLLLWLFSRRMTLPLLSLLRESQKSLEAKSTFLSTISHELRTPLGSILNLTQHLMQETDKPKSQKMLAGIERSATHLLAIINNILQLSRLEASEIIVHKEQIDLREIVEEIVEITEPLMNEKKIRFILKVDLPQGTIRTDPNLLKQVIINLLSNAIKFTPEGEISFTLTGQNDHYRLVVKDSGIGIERERLTHLFTPFYQTHTDIDTLKKSSGLGLALSQKVAHLLGGKITLKSEGRGKGVEAIFEFKSL